MLEVINRFAKLNLELKDFVAIIRGLNEIGYQSVIWQSKINMLATAGITKLDNDILEWIGYYNLRESNSFIYRGDLFVDNKDVIYLINQSNNFLNTERKIEIGIITEDPQSANAKLGKFAKAFIKVLTTKIDGRRTRHMDLKWYIFNSNDQLDAQVSFYKSFTYPILSDIESEASLCLIDQDKRQVMRRLSEAGSMKQLDIENKNAKGHLDTIQGLITQNLVITKYIVTCRKKSLPIGVIESPNELINQSNHGLSCPHCGQSFGKELLNKSYALSELGKKMLQSSHWMTLLVTKILIEQGIPEKCIIWNLTDAAEEVDCAVQFKDKVWIFELKDRDFEAGDAHPLLYRAIKFKANKTVIITTGRVSKDARKIFEDLSLQKSSGFRNGHPLYIEGLSTLKTAISTLIKNETLLHVLNKSKEISHASMTDFSIIFSKLFGKYIIEHKGKFTNDTISRHF